jgi:uncharacterized protein (DUF58 family)
VKRPQPWGQLILLFLLFGFLLRHEGLLALAGMLLVVIGVSWLWSRFSLLNVSYTRKLHYFRGFPGEEIECQLEVANQKTLPLGWLEITDKWPWGIDVNEEVKLTGSEVLDEKSLRLLLTVRGYHRIKRELTLRLRKRGVYYLGPTRVRSGDPFGFFDREKVIEESHKVTVFPEVKSAQTLGLNPDDPFGLSKTQRRLYEDASRPVGVRDYHPEDGFRHIHWPATARVGALQTRVFQPISGLDLIICLNVATFEPHWSGVRPGLLEEVLSIAATVAKHAFENGYRVGLISNGGIAHAGRTFRVPPGRSPNHLPYLLEALASLTPVVSGPFDRFILKEAPHLEYGSTLLVITGVLPDSLRQSLLRLKGRGRKVILISLAEEIPEPIPDIVIQHLPYFDEKVTAA